MLSQDSLSLSPHATFIRCEPCQPALQTCVIIITLAPKRIPSHLQVETTPVTEALKCAVSEQMMWSLRKPKMKINCAQISDWPKDP